MVFSVLKIWNLVIFTPLKNRRIPMGSKPVSANRHPTIDVHAHSFDSHERRLGNFMKSQAHHVSTFNKELVQLRTRLNTLEKKQEAREMTDKRCWKAFGIVGVCTGILLTYQYSNAILRNFYNIPDMAENAGKQIVASFSNVASFFTG
jgi:hypothetical protein